MQSGFSMTEQHNPGSDPRSLTTRAELDGDEWVINGHKWFTSGADGASFAIVMVITNPEAPNHYQRQGLQRRLQQLFRQ